MFKIKKEKKKMQAEGEQSPAAGSGILPLSAGYTSSPGCLFVSLFFFLFFCFFVFLFSCFFVFFYVFFVYLFLCFLFLCFFVLFPMFIIIFRLLVHICFVVMEMEHVEIVMRKNNKFEIFSFWYWKLRDSLLERTK